ncbi:MAG: hypothetical protein ACREBU_23920 [Nitrososphaera sp.]
MKSKALLCSLALLLVFVIGCEKKGLIENPTDGIQRHETFVTIKGEGKLVLEDGTILESQTGETFRLPEKYWATVETKLGKSSSVNWIDVYVTFVSTLSYYQGGASTF